MLKRVQNYMQANILQAWLISAGITLAIYLALFCVTPGPKKPEAFLIPLCFVFGLPTGNLILRFTDERRREQPIAPEQEAQVGMISFCAVLCSIGALGILLLDKPLGLSLSSSVGMRLLFVFSLSEMLALLLGCAARGSKLGHWGFTLSILWLLLLVSIAAVKMFFL